MQEQVTDLQVRASQALKDLRQSHSVLQDLRQEAEEVFPSHLPPGRRDRDSFREVLARSCITNAEGFLAKAIASLEQGVEALDRDVAESQRVEHPGRRAA